MTWMLTNSLKTVDLIEPHPGMIDFHDIAISLAAQPRFNGHARLVPGYSVLQHSLLVGEMFADPVERRYALLHDAHEAYTGDIITPVKQLLSGIAELEARLDAAIFVAAGLEPQMPVAIRKRVAAADLAVFRREITEVIGITQELYEIPDLDDFVCHARIVAQRPAEVRIAWLEALSC